MSKKQKSFFPKQTLLPEGVYLFAHDKNSPNGSPEQQLGSYEGRDTTQRDVNGHAFCIFKSFNTNATMSVSFGAINATLRNETIVDEAKTKHDHILSHLNNNDRTLLQKTFNAECRPTPRVKDTPKLEVVTNTNTAAPIIKDAKIA